MAAGNVCRRAAGSGAMQVRVIVNPISGRRSTSAVVERLGEALRRRGCRWEVVPTRESGDAVRLAAQTPKETHAVVVVGGDGTVREVAEGLLGRRVPLVVLPAGTENVLAKHFGYRADVGAVAGAVMEGCEEAYDVGVCGERKFLLMVGIGLDGEVARRLFESRTGHISYGTWTRHGLAAFWGYRFPALCVDVEGRRVFEGRAMAWAGIIPRYAMGSRLLDRARTDDGLLDVRILPCDSKAQILAYAARLLSRRPLRRRGIQYHQCHHVRISAADRSEMHFQIDGDYGGTLPVECSLIEAGVRFLRLP